MHCLAGDIGGTKTLLRLTEERDGQKSVVREQRFESGSYPSFSTVLRAFLQGEPPPEAACFAVAGPVVDGRADITNLKWEMDELRLANEFGIRHVRLVNDFFAVAKAVPLLGAEDLVSIQAGRGDPGSPIAILGAGTGLGEAILLPEGDDWRVVPSEGGHADYAPTTERQLELLRFLIRRHGHVSYERVVSGHGLINIYEFLLSEEGRMLPAEAGDLAATIAKQADSGDALAQEAFNLFVESYGSESGNLALKILARGGVYLAGGVAAKNVARFTDGRFLESFLSKGRFRSLMEAIPLFLITNAKAGLLGAESIARKLA